MKSISDIRYQEGEKRAIMTIAVGDKYQQMFDVTVPRIRDYAESIGVDFHLYGDDVRKPGEHPCHMKQNIQHLLETYDRVLYIDADCFVKSGIPNLFDEVPQNKLGVFQFNSYAGKSSDVQKQKRLSYSRFVPYLRKYNKEMAARSLPEIALPANYDGSTYYSAGLFLCTASTNPHVPPVADIMRIPTNQCYDQSYFNAMIIKHCIPIYDIGWKWHMWGGVPDENYAGVSKNPKKDCYIIHYAGNVKGHFEADLGSLHALSHRKHKFHVHFTVSPSLTPWILEHMIDAIAAEKPPHIRATMSPAAVDIPGTISCMFTYRCFRRPKSRSKAVVFYTHPEDLYRWKFSATHAYHHIVMCEQYRDNVIELGADPNHVTVAYPGVHDHLRSPGLIVFNPSRLNYALNRKRPDLWKKVAELPDVVAVCSEGKMSPEEIADWYQRCDVVFSSADLEGGPMSVLETIAVGRPIVARAGCGLVNDFKDGVTRYESDEEAIEIIKQMAAAKKAKSDLVANVTWANWGKHFWEVFEKIFDETGETYDENENWNATKHLPAMLVGGLTNPELCNIAARSRYNASRSRDSIGQALRRGERSNKAVKHNLRVVGNGAAGTRSYRPGDLKAARNLRRGNATNKQRDGVNV